MIKTTEEGVPVDIEEYAEGMADYLEGYGEWEADVDAEADAWEDRAWLGSLGDEWERHHADELVGAR